MRVMRVLVARTAIAVPVVLAWVGDGAWAAARDNGRAASAALKNPQGRPVGSVTMTETPSGLLVTGSVEGLSPGTHAIHVHERGRCNAPSFSAAGDHFNPEGRKHGFKVAGGAHAGDLPNIHVGADGRARFEFLRPDLALRGGGGLLDGDGAAVVVHASADDHTSQPAGDAGDPVACGALQPSPPAK